MSNMFKNGVEKSKHFKIVEHRVFDGCSYELFKGHSLVYLKSS